MKKNFKNILKEKGFYISLLTGAVSVVAVAAICLNVFQGDTNKNLTDLNEPKQEAKQNTNNQTDADNGKNNDTSENSSDVVQKEAADEDNGEIVKAPTDEELKQQLADAEKKNKQESTQTEEQTTVSAMGTKNELSSLKFNQEKGLAWPVRGDVIMKYSMDKGIYYQTLAQYRTNPAIIISTPEGTKVKSAYDCIVKKVSTNSETGTTVTTSIGSNYSVVYGQIENIKVKAGDKLKEGDVIGTIAKPTKYYSVEGSNLYFEVLEKDKPVDPMILLR